MSWAWYVWIVVQIERLRLGEGERWRSVRLAALADAPHAFSTTYADAVHWPAARWESQVSEFATFVAILDGHDVGVARGAVRPESDVRELISMWVAPSARRQGIGGLLIETVATWARGGGATALVLDVVASNAPAIALYERCGFVRTDGGLGEPELGEIRLVHSLSKSPA